MIDREQMLTQVNFGFGDVLNDLWGKGLDHYDDSLPQRVPDIDKAKSLLKKAGYENLTTTITTSNEKSGQMQAATLFAQQAKAAGVTINLRQVPADTYYSTGWPNYPFGQTSYECATIPYFYSAALLPGGPFNDIQWENPTVINQLKDALAEMDPGKSKDKWNAVQKTVWADSGWICWGSSPWLDGLSKKVQGATPIRWQLASFGGYDFENYWLA
jgi:peptide/nickel transport system substrate-binding protein